MDKTLGWFLFRGFNTASGMDCMQSSTLIAFFAILGVSIPQAVWIACNKVFNLDVEKEYFMFQYRKRYGLHAISSHGAPRLRLLCFNTASGMDCMQFTLTQTARQRFRVSIPQAVWIACNKTRIHLCLSSRVSIPQAVWIACNTVSRKPWKQ